MLLSEYPGVVTNESISSGEKLDIEKGFAVADSCGNNDTVTFVFGHGAPMEPNGLFRMEVSKRKVPGVFPGEFPTVGVPLMDTLLYFSATTNATLQNQALRSLGRYRNWEAVSAIPASEKFGTGLILVDEDGDGCKDDILIGSRTTDNYLAIVEGGIQGESLGRTVIVTKGNASGFADPSLELVLHSQSYLFEHLADLGSDVDGDGMFDVLATSQADDQEEGIEPFGSSIGCLFLVGLTSDLKMRSLKRIGQPLPSSQPTGLFPGAAFAYWPRNIDSFQPPILMEMEQSKSSLVWQRPILRFKPQHPPIRTEGQARSTQAWSSCSLLPCRTRLLESQRLAWNTGRRSWMQGMSRQSCTMQQWFLGAIVALKCQRIGFAVLINAVQDWHWVMQALLQPLGAPGSPSCWLGAEIAFTTITQRKGNFKVRCLRFNSKRKQRAWQAVQFGCLLRRESWIEWLEILRTRRHRFRMQHCPSFLPLA